MRLMCAIWEMEDRIKEMAKEQQHFVTESGLGWAQEGGPDLGGRATHADAVHFVSGYIRDPIFAETFVSAMDVLRQKNVDYSQGEDKTDRIAAFRRIARDVNVPVEKVWAIFSQKHWGAIMKYVKDGTVESEPLQSRAIDLINYLVLLVEIDRQIVSKREWATSAEAR